MRVNDLAKELNRTNKELLAELAKSGIEGKTHASNISESEAALLRKSFAAVKEEKAPLPAKEEPPKKEQKEGAAEPHKKKFAAVFRPQNAQQKKPLQQNLQKQIKDKVLTSPEPGEGKIKEASPAPKKQEAADLGREESEIKKAAPVTEPKEKFEDRKERDLNTMTESSKSNLAEKTSLEESKTSGKLEAAQNQRLATENKKTAGVKEEGREIGENKAAQASGGTEKNRERMPEKSTDRNKDFANRSNQGQRPRGEIRQQDSRRTQGGQSRAGRESRPRDEGQRSQGNRFGTKSGFGERAQGTYGDRNQGTYGERNQGRAFSERGQAQGSGERAQGRGFADRKQGVNREQGASFGGYAKQRSGDFKSRSPRPEFMDKDKDEKSFDQRSQSRQGGRKGQAADKKPVMDAALAKKTTNTKANKNNFKNTNKTDKKHRTEDGPAKGKISKHPFIMPVKPKVEVVEEDIKEIIIPEVLTIKDLAAQLKLQPSSIVKKLFLKGKVVNINSDISFEQAEEIALEYDVICTKEEKVDVIEELLKEEDEDEKLLLPRPPVVCVMGHVDHGKTSLLDAIRKTNVTGQEAGGITQHIGAYMVKVKDQPITFLDTPGHEAFTAMRMRGAQSTDIAILVVAADDGVMPQTVEAISHAKAAGVEIIVAVNKVDKPSANIDRVNQELSEHELIPEDWGGNTIFCPVSAKTGQGIENLLEMIILAAELKELRANPDRRARGLVIEAELDRGKGPVATVLVQKGTLHVGDFIAAGACSGKVRAMMNDKGQRVKTAGPSTPVEILGLDNVPNAGEVFVATENDKEAKAFAATFISESKNKLIEETKAKLSLDDLFTQIKAGNIKELPIIIKADVQGSVEAVKQSLTKLSNEEVQVKVIHGGVGAINESDVALAAASNAIIIGFNVRADSSAKASADHENVDLRLYKVIYQAIEDVESAMKGMLEPVFEDRVIGHAEIRQLFKASGIGTIAGSYVLDGKFQRGCKARISRDGEQIFEGNLASLKRFKDDVKEVATGYECGLVFEKFNDIQEGDLVEAYITVEVSRA